MKIEFFCPIIPPTVTHQEKKINWKQHLIYEDDRLKAAREKLSSAVGPHRPETPIEGVPIRLIVKWLFPKGKHPACSWKTTKPDTDNMIKLLKDVMTVNGFWKDDALVASEINEKFWANQPGIYIKIETMESED